MLEIVAMMLSADHIVQLQEEATRHWHDASAPAAAAESPLEALVLEQHRANFDLWHREDEARDQLASDHAIAEVKHAIDGLNQRRNDLMERIDRMLLEAAPSAADAVPLHSETPGMMIDRLSILELKQFHTAEEIERADAREAHRDRNRTRMSVLNEQTSDLRRCLDELWREVMAGRRRFKLYRQMKMYNDPELNPVLYGAGGARRE
ncbi:MAG TPA: DUF4254 domain-containing protein [Acidobacteriaceae bacterium]|jgi:hypothetical protein|nr:DUF4254 domain-containing protein [Acidobacteriaceae bacterium]